MKPCRCQVQQSLLQKDLGPKLETATKSRALVSSVVCIATYAVWVNMIGIATVLPEIASTFSVNIATAQWVLTVYLLPLAGTQLFFGRVGDSLGRARIFLWGLVFFTAGSAACAFSLDIWQLVYSRLLQGLGGAMVSVSGPAILATIYPSSERGKAMGLIQMSGGLASASGPILSGLLAESLGVTSAFYLSVPLGGIGLLLTATKLREASHSGRRGSFDLWSGLLLFGAITSFVLSMGHGQEEAWEAGHTVTHVLPLLLVSIISLSLFASRQRSDNDALLPITMLKNRVFATSNVINLILHMTMIQNSFLLPFYLQRALGYSLSETGILLIPFAISLSLSALVGGWLSDRIGTHPVTLIGMLLGTLGLTLVSVLGANPSISEIVSRLAILGATIGFFVAPNVSRILGSAPRERIGTASGMQETTRQLGHAIGVPLSSSILFSRYLFYSGEGYGVGASAMAKQPFLMAFQDTLMVGALVMILGFCLSLGSAVIARRGKRSLALLREALKYG